MYIISFLVNNRDNKQILEILKNDFSIKEEAVIYKKQIYYDTFDSLLQKRNYTLYQLGRNLILQSLSPKINEKSIIFKNYKNLKFWYDFPTEYLQKTFKDLIGIRALIPVSNLKKSCQYFNILDDEEKIVAKILLEEFYDQNKGFFFKTLTLKPIKGYSKYYNKLHDLFNSLDFLTYITQKNFIKELFKKSGTIPIKYSSKPAKISNPHMPASEAINKLFLSLVKVIETNKCGVINDIDSEFLHDYRVAIRRTRSLISLLKIAFKPTEIQHYKDQFANFACSTNKLRDYDVYLLNKNNYKAILPSHLHQGLNQFFINIKKRKKYEHKKLVELLNSKNYEEFLIQWKNVIHINKIYDNKNSLLPIINLASRNIYKRFKKVIKKGTKINDYSPDEELHSLRIDCKKLRYLIEFFATIFPENDITVLVSQLKKLQDCLGEFNDYSIQQIHLEDYLLNINSSTINSIELAATIGALISASYREKQKRRSDFFEIFQTFASTENINLFIKLFRI